MMWEAKHTLVIIKKSQSSLLNQQLDPIREKNQFFCFEKCGSLDHYPKDFKFSGYEGLIYRKIRLKNST